MINVGRILSSDDSYLEVLVIIFFFEKQNCKDRLSTGPEIGGGHSAMFDLKTTTADVKSSYVKQSCLLCFCSVLRKLLFLSF